MKFFVRIITALFAVCAVLVGPSIVMTPQPAVAAVVQPTLRYKVQGQQEAVKELQRKLKEHGYYTMSIDGDFGVGTANAVLNYQRAQGLGDDAVVGPLTWGRLYLSPQRPIIRSGVPSDVRTMSGVVLYVDKAQRKLFWQRDGQVIKTFDVRVGGFTRVENKKRADYGTYRVHHTVRGTYRVYNKDPNPKSKVYGEGAMPYSVMFDPNMYVHYSADFAASGYRRSSHGCVNVGNLANAKWIFSNTPIDARVVVR